MGRNLAAAAGLVAVLLAGTAHGQEPLLLPVVSTSLQPAPCVCPPPAAPALPAYTPPPPCNDRQPLFAIQAMLGQQLGVRGQVAVDLGKNEAIVVEGFYGELYNNLGSAQTLGAGSRFLWRTPWPDCTDSLVFGPGIGVFFLLDHNSLILLTPSFDVGYVHDLGGRLEFEIGLDLGLGIGVSGHTKQGHSALGDVTTLISVYTGLRF